MPEPGGKPFNAREFAIAEKRADLCAIALAHCWDHGAKIIDEILRKYEVTRKSFNAREAG